VVSSFVPRPYDFHPGAIKVPYHHANVDSDEVIFYSEGDFMSRAGSAEEEVAVMIDTFRRLRLGPAALACADDYARTWSRT
jgi:homogentisate 1,2-dioxygenase